jgi:hypothetical protein
MPRERWLRLVNNFHFPVSGCFKPDGLARFLRLNRSGRGDYTRDRMEWQKNLTVAHIVASLNRPK